MIIKMLLLLFVFIAVFWLIVASSSRKYTSTGIVEPDWLRSKTAPDLHSQRKNNSFLSPVVTAAIVKTILVVVSKKKTT